MTAFLRVLWARRKVEGSAKLTGCYFDVQSEEKKGKNSATILATPTAMSLVVLLVKALVIQRDRNLALLWVPKKVMPLDLLWETRSGSHSAEWKVMWWGRALAEACSL